MERYDAKLADRHPGLASTSHPFTTMVCGGCGMPLGVSGKKHLIAGTNEWVHDACADLPRIHGTSKPEFKDTNMNFWNRLSYDRALDKLLKAIAALPEEDQQSARDGAEHAIQSAGL